MDGANADSDHSMSWEDFFGSTTDLTPTLIGIYDSLLEPDKRRLEVTPLETAKDARNNPPLPKANTKMTETNNETTLERNVVPSKEPSVPLILNKSSIFSNRNINDQNGASEVSASDVLKEKIHRTIHEVKSETSSYNLSPNVKRMISGVSETTTLKFQKKPGGGRSSTRMRSNIPLVGATSKISQCGVDLVPSVEIYDQPTVNSVRSKEIKESPTKTIPIKPQFKLNEEQTVYDVPTNNRPAVFSSATENKAFDSLSLPYIDQSIELSISADREFDTKVSSKENSPQKTEKSPTKITGTNSLNRKDFKDTPSFPKYPEKVGSTGNLKTVTEKDRLNPPTVEVSLSMSSIASSSSTSSSGVQNKGGVNSAYLASIESLDDHSDADMTSANGSNNFVNNAGILKNCASEERRSDGPRASELPGLSQLERVCAEIVQTENVYVEDLRQVVQGYLHIWRRDATFSEEELSELFNNIEDIYEFNRSLCEELNTCQLDATCIAQCFVNNTTGFSIYTSYCTGYPRTMKLLAELASKPASAREFRERQLALDHPLPLASYLLKPVQRILKYHLLLQNVVKQCASIETTYALRQMTGIAHHIDDMKRRHEHAVRVQEIQSLLYGWIGPDLTTYGELCAEGKFRVFGAKAMRHAFLFDKMLLVTKNREDGVLAYKSHIMCNNMMLVESIDGAPLSFHVIPWDAPRAQITLQARSHRHKREWTLLLKRVILENYHAVIPVHARQLVMELGQNKTDDDILAEKSHSLITQASMRKQLSAPEYLEKRKIERDRRKTFDNGLRGRLKKENRKHTPTKSDASQECDCAQVSSEKGIDYTCDVCYVDLCSECEGDIKEKNKVDKCSCRDKNNELTNDKCPECTHALHYIDSGSAEHLERRGSCKCADFKSSQESFCKEFPSSLNKTRGYHSSDNIVGYTDHTKSKEDLSETNNSMNNVRNLPKTCLKCAKIKENIVVDSNSTTYNRKSRCNDNEKRRADTSRSTSRDDPQRSKLSKIGTWRRKSEPGLQHNTIVIKKSLDSDTDKSDVKSDKIEFACRNCGSTKISRKNKLNDTNVLSDSEDLKKRSNSLKPNIEIKMYNTKHIPKRISKLRKSRNEKNRKGFRIGADTTAKFYADFSTDVSTENILHISESNDSLNVDKEKDTKIHLQVPTTISKDEDIDEETYKKLIEKTDSFKKNELEKVKYLNKQKVINEGSEVDDKETETQDSQENFEEPEQPLEQIISQLLMQNREFQKLVKKQQLRNTAQRRHQRLLKSHSNPEPVVLAQNSDLKNRYVRQTSTNEQTTKPDELDGDMTKQKERQFETEEDHIYETLRVVNPPTTVHKADSQSKMNLNNTHDSPPNILPPPPEIPAPDSDYVYLSFNVHTQDTDGIYDVPMKPKDRLKTQPDLYVPMEKQSAPLEEDNVYDNLVEVNRRRKDVPDSLPSDYMPMNPDQSPNTPEIWLSRQKEHFNVSRDRKSGSLPRSFQIITGSPDENNLVTFKCKPNSNSKTYLNREGKVMSTDRPYTIASDQSEISYDEVETYMTEGDILKFNTKKEDDYAHNISQSTLELEEEIDRCYKTNFEDGKLDKNKNENLLTASQPNLNTSMTSSCEILPVESEKVQCVEGMHPDHKIYKPTSNMLSLKNMLSRFKSRTPNKTNDDAETNANSESSPDSAKSDLKSTSDEKKSALNPRSYSRNLLKRFKSIIGDEHTDNNENKYETKGSNTTEEVQNNSPKSDIKVVITSTDNSPTTSSIVYTTNEALSQSVYEQATMTASQYEKNNLDKLSHSCDDITESSDVRRPSYEKSISTVTNSSITSSFSSTSPSKSNTSSLASLTKLPIYMQGSKFLGARIAQSDYVDPTTLISEKSTLKNVNVLINKSSVRPDSLFSNSSFVTSSSEGNYVDKTNETQTVKEKCLENTKAHSDESYYEKSFERIESVTDEDVFRDSAVYSDQEEAEEAINDNTKVKAVKRSIKNNSFKAQKCIVTTSCEKSSVQSRISVTTTRIHSEQQNKPSVPVKPKLTSIPSSIPSQKSFLHKHNNIIKNQEQSSSRDSISKTTKLNESKHTVVRSESLHIERKHVEIKKHNDNKNNSTTEVEVADDITKPQGNIHSKRLSYERASLDSATRKLKVADKRSSVEQPKTSKSVMERRMEIEQMSKTQTKPQTLKKPAIQPTKLKSVTTKVASYERSVSENDRRVDITPSSNTRTDIPTEKNSIRESENDNELKGSWVKQVVNKFQ